MKVLSSTSLSFIQVSSPNFRDTMLHNFFQRCWLLQYFQSKNFFFFFGWYHHQCVNLKIFKSKITHWVLSEKVTNTQITHTSLTLCTFAALTRLKLYWWKNLTRVWGNLLERPLTLLPSTSSEQFKNLRVARHKVHIHSLIKKVGCIMCSSFGFRTCFIKKK